MKSQAGTKTAQLVCNRIDNFARSVSDNAFTGAPVDVNTHSNAAMTDSLEQITFDFKAQVQQFLGYDAAMYIPQSLHIPHGRTIFTVYFGLWDLLEYSTLELKPAMEMIDRSIKEIFNQLDLLATHVPESMQVVLPRMVDVTYLPRYQSMANQTRQHFAELQQKGVFLSGYWNVILFRSASQWQKGAIFMPDPNEVALEILRVEQLASHRDTDAPGAIKHIPLSAQVDQLCLITLPDGSTSHMRAANVEGCSKTIGRLFRSALHRTNAMSHSNQLTGTRSTSEPSRNS
jgi:hypothetical protein